MRIKVGPFVYVVSMKKLRKKYGTCDFRTHEIFLDPNQSTDAMRDSLLHEVLHAVDDFMDIKQKEDEIRRRASGLLAVMRDNPKLMNKLLAKE